MEKPENTEDEALERAEKIKQLVLEKARYQTKIKVLKEEIEDLTKKIPDLDLQISSLLGLGKMETSTKKPGNPKLSIPQKGMVMDMVKVMSNDNPMTKDEIIQVMKEQNNEEPNPRSIRSYLSNLECFENIKKSDPRFNKKGWICHKEMLG
jgi:phage host-nuclease inhibitor protein Gam